MWNQCREVVVQQFKRQSLRIHVANPSLAWLQQCQSFSSLLNAQTDVPPTFGGLTIKQILSHTTDEMIANVGTKQFPKIQYDISQYSKKLFQQREPVACKTMLELFTVGQLTLQTTIMLKTLRYMLQHYPHEIDYIMYGEVYRILAKQRAGRKMMEIYNTAYPHFVPSVPEVVYRFGITAQVELHDVDAAISILEEMKSKGVEPTNEHYSRIIQGYARQGNHEKVLEWFHYIDLQNPLWHVTTMDRIILSLGMVNEPEKAFDFYIQANKELSGGTLIALLSVCRHNECLQQASDILTNRKQFDLELDARGYNAILETYEYLDQREDEILETLQEMTEKGIAFDSKTKLIVSRNQDVLQGTYFDQVLARQRSSMLSHQDEDHPILQKRKKRTPYSARPYLIRLLESDKLEQAVALANDYVHPLTMNDLPVDIRLHQAPIIPSNALRVPNIIATEVIQTYIAARQDDKIEGLLTGFELLEHHARIGRVFMDIMVEYTKGENCNHEFAYRAAKLMQQHHVPIVRMQLALKLFAEFKDPDAALLLCHQAIDECIGSSKELERTQKQGRYSTSIGDKEITRKQLAYAVKETLIILADHNRINDGITIISKAIQGGLEVTPFLFVSFLSSMRNHSAYISKPKGVVSLNPDRKEMPFYYTAPMVEKVIELMINHRVPITRATLGNIALPLSAGDKHHRLRLLECFEMMEEAEIEVKDLKTKQPFILPVIVYSMLLNTARREQERVIFERIYQDGMRVLKEESSRSEVPLDWEVLRISMLVETKAMEEAYDALMEMRENVGRLSYEAVIKVVRGLTSATLRPNDTKGPLVTPARRELLSNLMTLLEEREFKMTLSDTYDIVHLAKDAKLPELAIDIIRLYEKSYGRTTVEVLKQTSTPQTGRDKFAVKKMRTMYRTALKICEEEGQWKLSLQLNEKVVEMLQEEIKEAKRGNRSRKKNNK